jgi:hypothetical protein
MSLQLNYKNEVLHDEKHIKFLGLEIDKFLNWKTHVKLILPKLGNACFAIRNTKLCSNIETLRMIYHAYFHSIMKYGIIFWGNSPDVKKVFLLQKKDYKDNDGNETKRHMQASIQRLKYTNIGLPIHIIFDDIYDK